MAPRAGDAGLAARIGEALQRIDHRGERLRGCRRVAYECLDASGEVLRPATSATNRQWHVKSCA